MLSYLRRDIIVSGAIVLASITIFFIGFFFLKGAMEAQVARTAQARTLIREGTEAVGVLAKLNQDAPKAAEYKGKIELLLPKQEELLGFTRFADLIARAQGVQFKFSFQGAAAPGAATAPGSIPFGIEATGPYENVYAFLDALESKSNRFLLEFDGLTVEARGEAGYRVATNGRLYIRTPQPQ